ncbi:ferrous iron transport protein B, partial [Staphylococcus hominis]
PDDRQVFKIDYGKEIEDAIERMSLIIKTNSNFPKERIRFIAIQYLLDNVQISQKLSDAILEQIAPIKQELNHQSDLYARE